MRAKCSNVKGKKYNQRSNSMAISMLKAFYLITVGQYLFSLHKYQLLAVVSQNFGSSEEREGVM